MSFSPVNAAEIENNTSLEQAIKHVRNKRAVGSQSMNQAQIFEKQLLAQKKQRKSKRTKRISGTIVTNSGKSTMTKSSSSTSHGIKGEASLPSLANGMFVK